MIELLLSVFLSGLLMTMLIQFYLSSKQSYTLTQAKLEENLARQMVSQSLRDSLRYAGFTPCLSLNHLQVSSGGESPITAIQIKDQGSHLTIRRMSEHFSRVIKIQDDKHILVSHENSFKKQDFILIADCFCGEVHQIETIKQQAYGLVITLDQALHCHFTTSTYLGHLLEEQFFIKKNNRGLARFFYKINHADQLALAIDHFRVEEKQTAGHLTIDVHFGKQDEILHLATRVRNS